MKFLRNITLICLFIFLNSCGSIKDGFSDKKNNSDEFLVEKKSPLMMPPDYDELPLPNSEAGDTQNSDNNVKKLIVNNENDNSKSLNQDGSNKKIEESLLEKIKNN